MINKFARHEDIYCTSGLLRRVVLWQDITVSEVHAASIFRVNVGILP
jgi:hypothetical protein